MSYEDLPTAKLKDTRESRRKTAAVLLGLGTALGLHEARDLAQGENLDWFVTIIASGDLWISFLSVMHIGEIDDELNKREGKRQKRNKKD